MSCSVSCTCAFASAKLSEWHSPEGLLLCACLGSELLPAACAGAGPQKAALPGLPAAVHGALDPDPGLQGQLLQSGGHAADAAPRARLQHQRAPPLSSSAASNARYPICPVIMQAVLLSRRSTRHPHRAPGCTLCLSLHIMHPIGSLRADEVYGTHLACALHARARAVCLTWSAPRCLSWCAV